MRIQRRKRPHAAVETGALADILFFLLIFFLMVASLSAANMMKLQLPKSDAVEKTKKETIHVYLSIDGKYFVEKRAVSNLEDELAALKKNNADQTVLISIEKDRSVQELVTIVDMVNRVKMKPVLATAKNK